MSDNTYNGWANYETWNVFLWIGNDEGLYQMARASGDYNTLASTLIELGLTETPDGVRYHDPELDITELDEAFSEL